MGWRWIGSGSLLGQQHDHEEGGHPGPSKFSLSRHSPHFTVPQPPPLPSPSLHVQLTEGPGVTQRVPPRPDCPCPEGQRHLQRPPPKETQANKDLVYKLTRKNECHHLPCLHFVQALDQLVRGFVSPSAFPPAPDRARIPQIYILPELF